MVFYDNDGDAIIRFSEQREEELKEMLSGIPHDLRQNLDKWFRAVVKEEIELSHKNLATSSDHVADKCHDFESRSLELRISKIASPLLTGHPIEGLGGVPVRIALVDSLTKEEVKSGPVASGSVEIIVVKAKDDGINGNEIERKLVHKTEGKRSATVDNLCLKLVSGTALLPKVSFVHKSTWMSKSEIRLEARFVDSFSGFQVKDAHTDPFLLMDRRTEATKNHPVPSLDDEVWRLNKINRKGPLAKSLMEANVKTVRDFIVCQFRNPQFLKEIFAGANHAKNLELTVKHAQECRAILKYNCSSFHQKTEVVFNVAGEVLGLYMGDAFSWRHTLSETQKEISEREVKSAFENWEKVNIVNEDQFVANSSHLLNESISQDGLDMENIEASIFSEVFDEPDLNPQSLSEPQVTRFSEFVDVFRSVLTPHRVYKKWRLLFCVVTLTARSVPERSLGDSHTHKKQRLS